MDKVAIMIDSGGDLTQELIRKLNIKVLPLKIIYGNTVYSDGVDIEPKMVYDRFPEEIPSTSTPNFGEINEAVAELRQEGYNKILAVCISSGLSSTYQNMTMALGEVTDMQCHVVDTKNISVGAGILAFYAAMLLRRGDSFDAVCQKVDAAVEKSHIYYYMDTLDYLRAGGRIGKVTGAIGALLNIKPIISCNKQGVYHIVSMIRGQKRGLKKLLDVITDSCNDKKAAMLAVMHGNAPEAAQEVIEQLKTLLPKATIVIEKQINASLAVHTGPGLVGILLFQPDDIENLSLAY